MHISTEKTQESKNKSIADNLSSKQGKPAVQFSRDQSHNTSGNELQQMANSRPKANKPVEALNNYTIKNPVQRKSVKSMENPLNIADRAFPSHSLENTSQNKVIQREVELDGDFNVDNSVYQQALIALYQEDIKDLTPEEVASYGVAPLIMPLIPKLITTEKTSLLFSTVAPKGNLSSAVTELFVFDGEWKDADKKPGKDALEAGTVTEFRIKVIITPALTWPDTLGTAVQVLTHELSVHAEDFSDLINAYWKGGSYNLGGSGSQHTKYGKGENVRYNQLSARMKAALPGGESEDFGYREEADKLFMNRDTKPATHFDFS